MNFESQAKSNGTKQAIWANLTCSYIDISQHSSIPPLQILDNKISQILLP